MRLNDKNIRVGDSEWAVRFVDEIPVDDPNAFLFGETDQVGKVITIATLNRNGDKLPMVQIERTLGHEVAHAMFGEGMYLDCNGDEPLVEWIGRCLVEVSKQGLFK